MTAWRNLASWLRQQELEAVLVTGRTNVRYFSGFAGSAGVLAVSGDVRKIFVDFRYVEQAEQTAPEFEVVRCQGNPLDAAADFLQQQAWRSIGFEEEILTVAEFSRLQAKVTADRWRPVRLEPLRTVKTAAEIENIVAAAVIADTALTNLLPMIRPGATEIELAAALEYEMRKLGSEKPAFETILASGPRSALPHGSASGKKLDAGDFVVIDFGATFSGYRSDMTRTVCVGTASAKQREVYGTVLKAQLAGLAAVRPGVLCRDVDKAARAVIEAAGYGAHFGHGLGHGVGLDIHESPRLSPTAGESRLEPGMMVTVEPGVYLPGWGGVRIEDLVVVTETGCRILSPMTKDLLELNETVGCHLEGLI